MLEILHKTWYEKQYRTNFLQENFFFQLKGIYFTLTLFTYIKCCFCIFHLNCNIAKIIALGSQLTKFPKNGFSVYSQTIGEWVIFTSHLKNKSRKLLVEIVTENRDFLNMALPRNIWHDQQSSKVSVFVLRPVVSKLCFEQANAFTLIFR